MLDVGGILRAHRVAVVVQAPRRETLIARALAAVAGGVRIVSLPVSVPFVAEIAAEIGDRADEVTVAIEGVVLPEQLAIAAAAGIELVLSPLFDEDLSKQARDMGLALVPGAATATEILRVGRRDAGPVLVWPAPQAAHFERLVRSLAAVPLLAGGGVGPDDAPQYLEAGAIAVIVDRGLFPRDDDDTSTDVIAARASALVEICADVAAGGRASRP